ncbi:MAG: hypothetical protein GX130_09470 [Candidatus Hydrogenedens sp.]|jgi:hypothetical protein|nr:hypothetical protein [Candidatus Hydrogenedens sp.]
MKKDDYSAEIDSIIANFTLVNQDKKNPTSQPEDISETSNSNDLGERKQRSGEKLRQELTNYNENRLVSSPTETLPRRSQPLQKQGQKLNFNDPESALYTSPLSFCFRNKQIKLPEQSWTLVIPAFLETLLTENLIPIFNPLGDSPPFFLSTQKKKASDVQLFNGQWVNIPPSIPATINLLKEICRYCTISLEELDIRFHSNLKKSASPQAVTKKTVKRKKANQKKQYKKEVASATFKNKAKLKDSAKTIAPDTAPDLDKNNEDSLTSRMILLDFKNPLHGARTLPVAALVDNEFIFFHKRSWVQALITLVEMMIEKDSPQLKSLEHTALSGKEAFFSESKNNWKAHQLSNGKWMNTAYRDHDIIKLIGLFFQHCDIALEKVKIGCLPRTRDRDSLKPLELSEDTLSRLARTLMLAIPSGLEEKLSQILEQQFSNGFDLTKPDETTLFRQYALEEDIIGLPEKDEHLRTVIEICGLLHKEKIFSINEEVISLLQHIIGLEFLRGANLIYYGPLYKIHEVWLRQRDVTSQEFLKALLQKISLSLTGTFEKDFFTLHTSNLDEIDAIQKEIQRISKGRTTPLTNNEISELLPYIPKDKIAETLELMIKKKSLD